MASGIQKFNPLGGLDQDTDPNYVRDGSFVDAKNVRAMTDNTESTGSVVPIKGTVLAFTIPETTAAQNKIYRIHHNADSGTSRTVTMYRTDGTTLCTFTYLDGATVVDTATNFGAEVVTELAAVTPVQSATLINGIGSVYTDFELTTALGYEYTMASTGANEVVVECIQEAWDTSLLGEAHVIGSYDLLGDLFVLSTPNTSLPTEAVLTATAANFGGGIRITTTTAHGLTEGASYKIMTDIGTVPSSGTWIVDVFSSTIFDLENSVFSGVSASTAITIISNVTSIGEIGVGTFNNNTETWTYTTLLKTKEWYFSTKKQADMAGELNAVKRSIYWTNDYETPRAFYYSGDYVADGAITAINSGGIYAYDSIDEETNLFVFDSGANLEITGQEQSGGGVTSGNWRYTFRFLTASLVATDVAELTNPISVFSASTASTPDNIYGDDAGVITGKINTLELTGILPGLFKYVELIGINYVDTAIVGYTISRTALDLTSTSISLRHTGLESDITFFDLGLLSVASAKYQTARNIRIIDSRMVLSNLTSRAIEDLSDWAQTIEHSLSSSQMPGVLSTTQGTYRFGEYLDPMNVYDNVGYTDNETYRFGIRGRFKDSGELSPVFWVDDIKFDTSATNITTPDRRVSGLASFDLTETGNAENVYVRYVQFSNINLDYLVDGIPVRDIFSEILIERAECIPEILACGCGAMTMDGTMGTFPFVVRYTAPNFGEFMAISGALEPAPTANVLYPSLGANANREITKLYSPDILCLGNTISLISGDVILNYGTPETVSPDPANIWQDSGDTWYSSLIEYNGFINSAAPVVVDLDNTLFVASNAAPTSFGGVVYDQAINASSGTVFWANRAGLLLYSTDTFTNVSGNDDYGFYYMQYFREIPYVDPDDNKYGSRATTSYVPTGAYLDITSSSASTVSINVFGGDTFTSKMYLKHRGPDVNGTGGGGGVGFYAQSKVNHQMMHRVFSWAYPAEGTTAWLTEPTELGDAPDYNSGYSINDDAQVFAAYDSEGENISDFPNRIIWSDLKVQSGLIDGYRNYLPLNFKDLDLSFGQITHHDIFNGELVTWQQRKLQRQYFNTRGQLDTTGLGIIIGDGSVLSRDGQTMSAIGTKHKWSVIQGKSMQGNDTFYWINTELKKAVRLGYDGTVTLSDIKGMRSFFANNLTWVDDLDTPADGFGICGFWDDRYSEAGWTIKGTREEIDTWGEATNYSTGDVVFYTPFEYESFYYAGEFYEANEASIGIHPGTGDRAETTFNINILANGDVSQTAADATVVVDIVGEGAEGILLKDGGGATIATILPGAFSWLWDWDSNAVIDAGDLIALQNLIAADLPAGWTALVNTYTGVVTGPTEANITFTAPAAQGDAYNGFTIEAETGTFINITPVAMSGGADAVDATQAISLYDGATPVLDILPTTFEWFCDWDGSAAIDAQDLADFQNAIDAEIAAGWNATVNTYTGTIGNVNASVTIVAPQQVGAAYNGFILQPGAGSAVDFEPNPIDGGSTDGPWDMIPRDDGSYYSNFTIIYNEVKDKFTHFASFQPNIYLKWKDTYLSPDNSIDGDTGDIHQHNEGNFCSWYSGGLEEAGYIEGVINEYPDEVKWPTAMRVQSDIVPNRFEFTTYSQESYLTDTEFETFERYHESPIKEDSTTSGVNDGDTSLLYGNWLKCKMFFEVGVYQKLYNFIVKFRISSRNSGK